MNKVMTDWTCTNCGEDAGLGEYCTECGNKNIRERCTSCGTQITRWRPSIQYCYKCGTKLPDSPVETKPKRSIGKVIFDFFFR